MADDQLAPMSDGQRRRLANLKPFTGRDDPRRHNHGSLSASAVKIREALQAGGPEYVAALRKATKKGEWGAAVKALEWIIGKPPQPVVPQSPDGGPVEFVFQIIFSGKPQDESETKELPDGDVPLPDGDV